MSRLQRDMRRVWVRGMNARRQLRHVPAGSIRAGILIERCHAEEHRWRVLFEHAVSLGPLYTLLERKNKKRGAE